MVTVDIDGAAPLVLPGGRPLGRPVVGIVTRNDGPLDGWRAFTCALALALDEVDGIAPGVNTPGWNVIVVKDGCSDG